MQTKFLSIIGFVALITLGFVNSSNASPVFTDGAVLADKTAEDPCGTARELLRRCMFFCGNEFAEKLSCGAVAELLDYYECIPVLTPVSRSEAVSSFSMDSSVLANGSVSTDLSTCTSCGTSSSVSSVYTDSMIPSDLATYDACGTSRELLKQAASDCDFLCYDPDFIAAASCETVQELLDLYGAKIFEGTCRTVIGCSFYIIGGESGHGECGCDGPWCEWFD